MVKKVFYTVLVTLLSLCSSIGSKAQPYRYFNVNSGLASSRINTIVQDFEGYIWIGTDDGLNRFDGSQFLTYRNHLGDTTSLINNSIIKVFEDREKRLWICTMKGICVYDRTLDKFEPYSIKDDQGSLTNQVNNIMEDQNGNFWIAVSNHGVISIDKSNSVITNLNTGNSELASNHVNCILEDKDGIIWLGSENGLNSFDPKTTKLVTYRIDATTSFPKISALCDDEDGNVWIGTLNEGVIIYDQDTQRFVRLDEDSEDNKKEACALLSDGYKMWVSIFDKGFKQYTASGHEEISFELNVPEVNVAEGTCHSMLKDRQGNIWAGLYQKGLLMISSDNQMFTNHQYNPFDHNSIADGAIVPVCCDSEGEIWLGKDGGGFYRLNKEKKIVSFINNDDAKRKIIVVSMCEDSDKNIWIGTYLDGVFRYNRKKQKMDMQMSVGQGPGHLLSPHVAGIIESEDGRLWMATNGGGVNIYNPRDGAFEYLYKQDDKPAESQLIDNWCNTLLIDSDRMLWIGTYNGICVYDIQKKEFIKYYKDQLPDKATFALHEDLDGDVWAGTKNGLACIHKQSGSIDLYGLDDGLPNLNIRGILSDKAGNLWVSTGDGIAMLNKVTNSFESYSTDKGMMSSECNGNSFDITPDGEIVIGTTEGYTSFFPENRSMRGSEPLNLMFNDLYIHSVKVEVSSDKNSVLKNTLGYTDRLTFNSRQDSFSISFSAIEYSLPQNIHYEVFLDGFDKKWQAANSGVVTYTNLDPGNYTLYVRAWKNNPNDFLRKDLKICVLPPFWASNWAKLIYILMFMTLGVVSYNHLKRVKDRKQKEEQLKDRLQFFTDISHEIKTPLTMIMAPLGKLISQNPNSSVLPTYNLMYKHAHRLLLLVNQAIDLSALANRQLCVEKTDISKFVEDIKTSFAFMAEEKGLSLNYDSSPTSIVGYVDQDILSKTLYNLISNAIKYTDEGEVDVELSLEDADTLLLKVCDTGRGIPKHLQEKIFERFFMIYDSSDKNRKFSSGIGLHLTSKIVQLHHGLMRLESDEGRGSIFSISLPINAGSYTSEEFAESEQPDDSSPSSHVLVPDHEAEVRTIAKMNNPRVAKKILVIEDEADIRELIVKEFSGEFSVFEADNGKEGLRKCIEINPDLVICDVLMPEMSGLVFCEKIRKNESFKNMPIFLLTARSALSQQTEGIMSGADAYITKPFDLKYLNAMVHRFINRETGVKTMPNDPPEATVPSADDMMLEKINMIIEDNIDNSEFDVDSFCRKLALSRTHLNRKIRELTGESPASYIKQTRLRKAASLLGDKSLSISEIAYMTGFSSPSYFSQAFREYYGVSPKEYS